MRGSGTIRQLHGSAPCAPGGLLVGVVAHFSAALWECSSVGVGAGLECTGRAVGKSFLPKPGAGALPGVSLWEDHAVIPCSGNCTTGLQLQNADGLWAEEMIHSPGTGHAGQFCHTHTTEPVVSTRWTHPCPRYTWKHGETRVGLCPWNRTRPVPRAAHTNAGREWGEKTLPEARLWVQLCPRDGKCSWFLGWPVQRLLQPSEPGSLTLAQLKRTRE